MNGRQLLLNDGTIIPNSEAGLASGFLWLWFTGYTLPEAASVFFDASKTAKIVFQYGDMETTWEGFTVCTNLGIDPDGLVSVCLTRGTENA